MIELFGLFALGLAAQQAMVPIPIRGRDYVTLGDSIETYSGTCDGRPVAAVVAKAIRGRAGRLTLRAGRIVREVPAGFLGGRLFGSGFSAAGIGCDGRRLMFRARTARIEADGRVIVEAQSATMDMRTGRISLSSLQTLPQDEAARDLR